MREEYHGNGGEGGIWVHKLFYNWNTLTANVWLPSLSELVGIDSNHYNATSGAYYSAMQGLNLSVNTWVDAQGGAQFAYFKQFNTSGGGQKIWEICGKTETWLRSSVFAYADRANSFNSAGGVGHDVATVSHAVHPAV